MKWWEEIEYADERRSWGVIWAYRVKCLDMTDAQLRAYQDRVAGIETRLAHKREWRMRHPKNPRFVSYKIIIEMVG